MGLRVLRGLRVNSGEQCVDKVAANQTTQVLVVGGGPTGLLASLLLSKYEIPHVLLERRADTLNAPAAHVVNTRTMEIYRQTGLNVETLYGLNAHPRARHVTWKGQLHGSAIGIFDMAGNRDALMAQSRFSSEHTTNISQHLLEKHLRQEAEASAYADIRFGVEWVEFLDEEKQTSRIRAGAGGDGVISHVFMVAADGAGSSVSRALGIKKVGPDALATFLNLTCEVDVGQIAGESETLLYWLLDPEVQGTIIVHDPGGLAVYMRPLAYPYETVDDYDDSRCEQILATLFAGAPYKVRHKGVWKMTAQVAERFREGPVFLAGDAVHRFPPTGGLGLNTGVGDVHNLVWKLAVALRQSCEVGEMDALLDSYELERKPVAQKNCDVSKRNSDKMGEVVRAIGLDPKKAGHLAKMMNSSLVKRLPRGFRTLVFKVLVAPLRRVLTKAVEDDEVQSRVASAIAAQKEHFASIGLDLGYVYRDGSAVVDAQHTPESEVATYAECLSPGARVPQRQVAGEKKLLHDYLDYDSFLLLSDHDVMPEGVFGLPVRKLPLSKVANREGVGLQEEFNLAADAWVLIRPDGHVKAMGEGASVNTA